jgi:DNA-3-methyladenine glycosylase I
MLILEGLQAGLSWSLILRKERTILEAFDGLDPVRVASYGPDKVDELMADPGVIRNRLKISSVVANARGFLAVSEEVGSFSGYLWGHAGHEPVVNDWGGMSEIPVRTDASERLSRDLKKRGFKFVGGGIVYSFMQAVGMVNDHLRGCAFRFPGENGRPGGPKS